MLRSELDRQLTMLCSSVLEMGQAVEASICHAMAALARDDKQAAAAVIAADDAVDRACVEIGDRCMRLITLQQPAIRDLRFVLATLAIAEELERIGDHAEGIAQLVCRLDDAPDPNRLLTFNGLAVLARVQLSGALDAYRAGDADRARAVWAGDDAVDALHARLVRTLLAEMGQDSYGLANDTYLLWLSHNLERIADRAANICERVVFVNTGERRIEAMRAESAAPEEVAVAVAS